MSGDDGYTLAETLAALVMIGLALGGLTAGVQAVGAVQVAAVRADDQGRSLRGAQAALRALLADQGPFDARDPGAFSGTSDGFAFPCGARWSCAAKLTPGGGGATQLRVTRGDGRQTSLALPGVRGARFVYGDQTGAAAAWPPASPEAQTLRSVVLLRKLSSGGEAPMAAVRLWAEQPADCAFDSISGTCRSPEQ